MHFNIIPETAEMISTIYTPYYDMKEKLNTRIIEMIETIAKAYGGTATCETKDAADITFNEPDFIIDDTGMQLNVKAMTKLTLDYLNAT